MEFEPFWYPLIPALIFGILGWVASHEGASRTPWAGSFAWGLGFLASYYAVKGGFADWPPREAMHWLFWSMVLAIPLGAFQGWKWSVPHFLMGIGLWAAFVWVSSKTLREHTWNDKNDFQIPAILVGVGALALWLYSALIRARPKGIQVPGAFALTLGGAAFVVGQSAGGNAHILGGLACVGLLWVVLALVNRGADVSYGLALPFLIALAGLLYAGVFFAETPQLSAALLLLAPAGIRVGWAIEQPKTSFLVSVLATAALVGAACYLAYSPAEASDPYGDPYAG